MIDKDAVETVREFRDWLANGGKRIDKATNTVRCIDDVLNELEQWRELGSSVWRIEIGQNTLDKFTDDTWAICDEDGDPLPTPRYVKLLEAFTAIKDQTK